MGDDQRGAAVEGGADGLLDQPVRLAVDGGRGLVQQQDLWRQQLFMGSLRNIDPVMYRALDVFTLHVEEILNTGL